jgi:hypothetical protein
VAEDQHEGTKREPSGLRVETANVHAATSSGTRLDAAGCLLRKKSKTMKGSYAQTVLRRMAGHM